MKIPAMTSEAEQECFRHLAFECAQYGAVVELGAWLGACTVALARGIEQRGAHNVVHSYDRFRWNPRTHGPKSGLTITNLFEAYKKNIAPVRQYVEPHKGEITEAKWTGGAIALLVCDGPKRADPVHHALTEFGSWLRAGSVMAWQDFCFPPAYAIPASLYRLRQHFTQSETVDYTAVFTIKSAWPKDVKLDAAWTLPEVVAANDYWREELPPACYAGVACGMSMFLSDLGSIAAGKALAAQTDPEPFQRIKKSHGRLINARYAELFRVIA